MTRRRAEQAVADLADLSIKRISHRHLIQRCWDLRDNLTVYDAAYVVVAETLGLTLVTTDRRMARAPDLRCDVELIA